MIRIERDFLAVHGIFAGLCAAVLAVGPVVPMGVRLLLLVIFYNIMVPVWGWVRGHRGWVDIWRFSFVLSLFQVFPDWFLAEQLNILVFPNDGCFRIGAVSGYMAGLWAIPLFIIIFAGDRLRERFDTNIAYLGVAGVSFLLFAGSEQTLWRLSWSARNVTMIGHAAVYILIPEVLLGVGAYFAYCYTRNRPLWLKIVAAFAIMKFYLGSAAFFYFMIEQVLK